MQKSSSYMKHIAIKYALLSGLAILSLAVIRLCLLPTFNYRAMPQGLCEGALPSNQSNWVSSLIAPSNPHYVAPLARPELASIAARMSQAHVAELNPEHLIAYRQSPVLSLTHWICIKKDGHVVSSATLGHYDFGKNRQWVESIRQG